MITPGFRTTSPLKRAAERVIDLFIDTAAQPGGLYPASVWNIASQARSVLADPFFAMLPTDHQHDVTLIANWSRESSLPAGCDEERLRAIAERAGTSPTRAALLQYRPGEASNQEAAALRSAVSAELAEESRRAETPAGQSVMSRLRAGLRVGTLGSDPLS